MEALVTFRAGELGRGAGGWGGLMCICAYALLAMLRACMLFVGILMLRPGLHARMRARKCYYTRLSLLAAADFCKGYCFFIAMGHQRHPVGAKIHRQFAKARTILSCFVPPLKVFEKYTSPRLPPGSNGRQQWSLRLEDQHQISRASLVKGPPSICGGKKRLKVTSRAGWLRDHRKTCPSRVICCGAHPTNFNIRLTTDLLI